MNSRVTYRVFEKITKSTRLHIKTISDRSFNSTKLLCCLRIKETGLSKTDTMFRNRLYDQDQVFCSYDQIRCFAHMIMTDTGKES